jgi:RimJ/RimL family protein N-acetyltransferase
MDNYVKKSCKLVPMSKSMVNQEYLDSLNDRIYMKYSRQSLISHNIDSVKLYINEYTFTEKKRFFAFINEEDIFVGTCTLNFEQNHEIANLGFLVFKKYSGNGYGSNMLKLLISEAFKIPTLKFIEIGTHIRNLGMISIAKKAKMPIFNLNLEDNEMIFFRDSIVALRNKVID